MGYVASLVGAHRGIGVVSAMAPFEETRAKSQELIQSAHAEFILVHLATSIATCVKRDVKGLYARSSQSNMKLTGLNDPYELPEQPHLTIDTARVTVQTAVHAILGEMARRTLISVPDAEMDRTLLQQHIFAARTKPQIDGLAYGSADAAELTCGIQAGLLQEAEVFKPLRSPPSIMGGKSMLFLLAPGMESDLIVTQTVQVRWPHHIPCLINSDGQPLPMSQPTLQHDTHHLPLLDCGLHWFPSLLSPAATSAISAFPLRANLALEHPVIPQPQVRRGSRAVCL